MMRLICKKCGHEWTTKMQELPRRCPKCQTWLSEEKVTKINQIKVYTCVCGHKWIPRVEKPKNCPKCVRKLDETNIKVEIIDA